VWRALSAAARTRAEALPPAEKLILQDSFRQPMHVRVPFPAWAMRRAEAAATPPAPENEDRQRHIRSFVDG
jgi:hypothetical protein